jgi:hypothetical protein
MPSKGLTSSGRVGVYDPAINPTFYTGLWKTCPLMEALHDPSVAVVLNDQFTDFDPEATNGNWVVTQATAGTAAISTAAPGVLELDCNSTTQHQGVQAQRVKSAFVPAANKHIWFETKFKVVDTYDKVQLFAGLSEIDTTVIASGALSTSNHIGWKCLAAAAGVLTFDSEKATAAGTSTAATIAEDTYITLGFYVNGVTSVTQYVNGVQTGTAIATANVPIVALYPTLVCQTDGTNDPILHVQYVRCVQLR